MSVCEKCNQENQGCGKVCPACEMQSQCSQPNKKLVATMQYTTILKVVGILIFGMCFVLGMVSLLWNTDMCVRLLLVGCSIFVASVFIEKLFCLVIQFKETMK